MFSFLPNRARTAGLKDCRRGERATKRLNAVTERHLTQDNIMAQSGWEEGEYLPQTFE
jgi:hypothetical protein